MIKKTAQIQCVLILNSIVSSRWLLVPGPYSLWITLQ